jgi:hypothetical protein
VFWRTVNQLRTSGRTDAGHDSGGCRAASPLHTFVSPRLVLTLPSPTGGRRGPMRKSRSYVPMRARYRGVGGVRYGLGCNDQNVAWKSAFRMSTRTRRGGQRTAWKRWRESRSPVAMRP